MHPRIHELLSYLDAQRQVLRDAVDAVPVALRDERPAPDRWSTANIIEHLAILEQRLGPFFAKRIADARAGGVGPDLSMTPILHALRLHRALDRRTRVTAPDTAQPTGLRADDAWAALERGGDAVRDALKSADGVDLATITHPHPFLGPLSFYEWFGFIGAHEARHAAQIREMLETIVK